MNLLMGDKNELILKKEEYKYVTPVEYPVRDTPDILAAEIKDGSVVLDVGCGQGKYTFLLERQCKLYGIDIEERAIELALSKNYTDAWCANIESDEENAGDAPQFQRQYDVIIMQDILEHVYDPAKVIIKYSKCLKDDGKILISVPNAAHIDILLHLLNGEFNYGQLGIMDNTHIRFYTEKSFSKMILAINESGQASFECKWIGGMFLDSEYCNQYERKFPQLWRALNGELRKNGLTNLFVLSKVPPEQEKTELNKIANKKEDVVSRLGELLEGNIGVISKTYMRSRDTEREWYEYIIETLQNQNSKQLEHITRLETMLSNAQHEQNSKQLEHIARLETMLLNAQHEQDNLLCSMSWRVTKPLRAVKKLIKNLNCGKMI